MIAVVLTSLMYWLIIKRKSHRLLMVTLTFLVMAVVGGWIAEDLFNRKPLDLEIVNV
jgi:hypothetical protein